MLKTRTGGVGGGRASLRWVAAAMAVVLAAPSWLLAGDYERWYAIEMAGKRAGWMCTLQKTEGDRITTSNTMKFSLGRGQASVSISMDGTFVETADGKPVSLKTVTKMGNMPTTMECTFGPDELAVVVDQAGNKTEMKRPLPEGKWLTPAAAESFVRQRLAASAGEIVYRTISPGGGLDPLSALAPATVTHRDCRKEAVRVMGREVQATRCTTTSSNQPGTESVDYLDEQGIPVRSETTLGELSMVTVAVDRAEALADRPAPELMVSTFVKPNRPIERPRRTSKAVYTLSVPEGKMPALPRTGAQRPEAMGEKSTRVVLDTRSLAPAEEADPAPFLAASATVNSDDAEIKKLAARGAGDAQGKPARAEAMRRFVHEYIRSKDLGVGFATASEVARSREGDCSEHGVLLAAMLRADGIPSRVACGLIYADAFAGSRNIFGYHMWTQALLEVNGKPTWVDLDGTLGDDTPTDATHIALAVSSLGDGEAQNALIALASIIGRLRISVESVE